jgi:RNA polymerase sigma-70 factor (ECF subfamily)
VTISRSMLASVMSETEAVEGAKQGDGECFQALYARNKSRVYSLCLRMVGNVETAEDLTQEAFFQLYRKIATLHDDSTFHLWFQRLTINVVLMHKRRNEPTMISLDQSLEDENKKEFAGHDQILDGSIDRVVLERAIENLAPGYRVVFVLHDVEGYEHNEIAKMMGCCVGNSKSQIHKARLKLRDVVDSARAENARQMEINVKRHLALAKKRDEMAVAAAA